MGIFKRFLLFSCTLLAVTAFFTQAYALSVTPELTPHWTGTETSNKKIADEISALNIDLGTLYYKADVNYTVVNQGGEDVVIESITETESLLDDSYQVSDLIILDDDPNDDEPFSDDISGLTITNPDEAYISENAYLLVKDGNANPSWYLFDLSAAGWDGQETLYLSGFWEGTGGSISHVDLYGTATVPELPNTGQVPVPSSAYLLGSALLLLPAVLRKKRRN